MSPPQQSSVHTTHISIRTVVLEYCVQQSQPEADRVLPKSQGAAAGSAWFRSGVFFVLWLVAQGLIHLIFPWFRGRRP
jgi:hypothetical protein